ncbi:hypothetical protein I79_024126 [Cricetulus griseus]|uniref:Uncharacterized protein n=1 Tax=Cricetulus griseus TaxID=10029 RepID=G3IJT9_CRIGR|nr:hypothetical protein I79_024126 [Cricetulus griseus]
MPQCGFAIFNITGFLKFPELGCPVLSLGLVSFSHYYFKYAVSLFPCPEIL